jgi:hypothetical protein
MRAGRTRMAAAVAARARQPGEEPAILSRP